jgi:hypothetical protein
MAAAWILFAAPAPAQDANGMAQNGADLNRTAQNGPAASGAAEEERTGVARPDAAAITVTPYNDSEDAASSAPAVETVLPAKPSAAIAAAAPAVTPAAALNRRAPAKLMPTADGEGIAASGKDAVAFDPDANIVTEETAAASAERDGRCGDEGETGRGHRDARAFATGRGAGWDAGEGEADGGAVHADDKAGDEL